MIEFTPGTKIGRIDIYGAQQFTDAYISEIQRRTALLKYAKEYIEKMLQEKKIASTDLIPSTQTMATVLSPNVDQSLNIITKPIHMQFVNKTMTFSADAIVDGGRGKKSKISVSLYKREEGDTYVYLYDAGKWEKLKQDERHEIIQILEHMTGCSFSFREAEGILEENKKLIQLHDLSKTQGLLRYGTYFLSDGEGPRDIHICLLPRNPDCIGMGIIEATETGELALCQRYHKAEMQKLFILKYGDMGDSIAGSMKNEWVPVYLTQDPEKLAKPIVNMLDHYMPDGPVGIIPLSENEYVKVNVDKPNMFNLVFGKNLDEYTADEKKFLDKVIQKLGI